MPNGSLLHLHYNDMNFSSLKKIVGTTIMVIVRGKTCNYISKHLIIMHSQSDPSSPNMSGYFVAVYRQGPHFPSVLSKHLVL